MFNLRQFLHRPKFDAAKQSGMNLDSMHEEQMRNVCELNEKTEISWNAGMNL
jgi:hypothetical protein